MVTYFIDYIPKTVKAQLSPYLPFKEGLEELEVGEGGLNDWGEGAKKGYFFMSIIRGNKGKGGHFDG